MYYNLVNAMERIGHLFNASVMVTVTRKGTLSDDKEQDASRTEPLASLSFRPKTEFTQYACSSQCHWDKFISHITRRYPKKHCQLLSELSAERASEHPRADSHHTRETAPPVR